MFAGTNRRVLGAIGVLVLVVGLSLSASALAKNRYPAKDRLPAAGKATTCSHKFFKSGTKSTGIDYYVASYAAVKHKHPAKSLLSCANVEKVIKVAGKKTLASPKVGKKFKVNRATYKLDWMPEPAGSGVGFGFLGGNVEITFYPN